MMRILITTCAICSAVAVCSGSALAGGKALAARTEIMDATGRVIGTATLTEEKKGVRVGVKVSGLTPGRHGLHFHETGVCTPPDFKSAAGHFNPFHKHHGMENPQGKHAGDLPNLEVKQDGTGELTVVAEGATLRKGKGSLLKEGGTALVIHADPDDNVSDPAGNAGVRIACGVVVKAE